VSEELGLFRTSPWYNIKRAANCKYPSFAFPYYVPAHNPCYGGI
jgi:hypothetical protein